MKITGGTLGGRTLRTRDGKGTRPTDARAREMLFNILGAQVLGARFLDLYGGTGSVGIEALSHGASSCVFVEQNAVACRIIKQNLQALNLEEQTQVWNATVKSALNRLGQDKIGFDLVFCDPPFDNPRELPELCKALDKAPSLLHNVTGRNFEPASPSQIHPISPSDSSPALPANSFVGEKMLLIQHHRKAIPVLQAPWRLQQERRAGESTISFFTLDSSGETVG